MCRFLESVGVLVFASFVLGIRSAFNSGSLTKRFECSLVVFGSTLRIHAHAALCLSVPSSVTFNLCPFFLLRCWFLPSQRPDTWLCSSRYGPSRRSLCDCVHFRRPALTVLSIDPRLGFIFLRSRARVNSEPKFLQLCNTRLMSHLT